MMTRIACLMFLCVSPMFAQDAIETQVTAAVRSAMAPALPFSDTDQSGVFPRDGKTEPLWMVRPPEPGDLMFEVIANPLNEANQLRAARAMAQIQDNIESAQRRAAAQYEHAIAEAKRTGKSQEVDGVTLGDEGVAGAKIDADSHVRIDVAVNQPSYKFAIASSDQPAPPPQVAIPGAAAVIAIASNTYRDERRTERYAEADTLVFLGTATPSVHKVADNSYEVTAAAAPSTRAISTIVVRLRGNEALIAELLRKTSWSTLLELIK
jgi:hypothetical protein